MTRTPFAVVLVLLAATAVGTRGHEEYGFVGTLIKVDLAKNRLTLKYTESKKDETVVLVLTPKTEITKDKVKVPKATLKTGLTVAVTAWGDSDAPEFEVLSIRIVPPLAK